MSSPQLNPFGIILEEKHGQHLLTTKPKIRLDLTKILKTDIEADSKEPRLEQIYARSPVSPNSILHNFTINFRCFTLTILQKGEREGLRTVDQNRKSED